jgi:ATP-dependent DNA helicase PIF1
MPLTSEQQLALDYVASGKSGFITGVAGTGKSFLLEAIVSAHKRKRVFVTASTGVAAYSISGTTIHAFAGIRGLYHTFRKEFVNRAAKANWKACELLIIDEVSMVAAGLLDTLENLARFCRGRAEVFGGIQVVMFGDFGQLPPVNTTGYPEEKYAFDSVVWVRLVKFKVSMFDLNRR